MESRFTVCGTIGIIECGETSVSLKSFCDLGNCTDCKRGDYFEQIVGFMNAWQVLGMWKRFAQFISWSRSQVGAHTKHDFRKNGLLVDC